MNTTMVVSGGGHDDDSNGRCELLGPFGMSTTLLH